MDYLIFRLYGPLASWGEAAVGPTRPSATYPGRSAILGLLAAALGIDRHDESAQASLRDSVMVAVKQLSAGVLVRDYHTAQVPGQSAKVTHHTRRDELSEPREKLHTILSTREYRCDGLWKVAVSVTDAAPWNLEELAVALTRPKFHLYLGRKSCPLAAPLAPQVVSAAGVREALSTDMSGLTELGEQEEARRLGVGRRAGYAWEGASGDLDVQETRYPYDQPLHRCRWQFASRAEHWSEPGEDG